MLPASAGMTGEDPWSRVREAKGVRTHPLLSVADQIVPEETYTLADLARLTGRSRSSVGHWLRGGLLGQPHTEETTGAAPAWRWALAGTTLLDAVRAPMPAPPTTTPRPPSGRRGGAAAATTAGHAPARASTTTAPPGRHGSAEPRPVSPPARSASSCAWCGCACRCPRRHRRWG